uniref:Prominin-like protein n=1 Tax=Clastoptera arizonana TaxID=38151 RepID=A0A1B6EEW6_9HEMI
MSFLRPGRTKSINMPILLLSAVVIVVISVQDSSCYLLGFPPNSIASDPFEAINYSVAQVNNGFNSSTKFYARGMGHLFYITRMFMDLVLQGEAYPEGLITVRNGNLRIADFREEWRTLIQHYGLMMIVVIAALLFVIIMPFIGLFFCCCRCAGRCGSRSQPFEKRYDPCRRHTHGFLLSGVTILIMFGVVCAFVTNEYMECGSQGFPDDLRIALKDTDLYINNTKKEVNNLLITNFNELEFTLNASLHRSGEIIKDVLVWMSKAEVISNLTNIVSGLSIIRSDLSMIDSLTINLKDKAGELEQALRERRRNLMDKLNHCLSHQPCVDFMRNYNITHLSLEKDFTQQLPNVTASLQNVSALLESDIEREVSKGQEEFEKVRSYIQNIVDESTPVIANSIKTAGRALLESAEKITGGLENVQKTLSQNSVKPLEEGESIYEEYGHYRYYLGLGVSCTLLVVLTCLVFGLFCGYCGKRPDGGYNDDCCDKGTGARFLMLGVWVMFLSSGGLMIITVIYFIGGMISERVICQPLNHPTNTRIFNIIDDYMMHDLQNPDFPPLKISSVISKCHHNQSIYSVLQLQNVVDVERFLNFPSKYGITKQIQELTSRIKLEHRVDILTPSARDQLIRLANSPLNNFNISIYTNVLSEKITSIDLMQLAGALNETARKLPPTQKEIKNSLMFQAQYLQLHQQNQVNEMLKITQLLETTANNLTEHLRFNEPSLKQAIGKMLVQVENAQIMLNDEGPAIVSKIAREFGEQFTLHVNNYMQRVVNTFQNDVGKCWPMSQVYNATVVSLCNKVVDPYNGFWASVGFILVLFLPAIILSVKLASLYQKSDPYPGPLVEAEYLYDAYAERDNIPLANVNEKKKKKQHRGGYHETCDTPVGGSGADYSAHLGRGERSRASPAGAVTQDQRFGDLAPKHWDFPNGGPPRYHSPPLSAEYERPPPYYYPGPAPANQSS